MKVENAKLTEKKIDEELTDLQATLANIEEVRPFDELTVSRAFLFLTLLQQLLTSAQVDDVGSAHPHITKAVETMMKKGKWTVPGKICTSLFTYDDFC